MADIRDAIDEIFIRGSLNQTTAVETYTLTTADEEYDLNQNIALNSDAKYIDDTSGFKFTCTDGSRVRFRGSANVAADKACRATFILYVNGVAKVTTPIGFAASTTNIPLQFSASKAFIVNENDTIELKAKSSVDDTTLTVLNLDTDLSGWLV